MKEFYKQAFVEKLAERIAKGNELMKALTNVTSIEHFEKLQRKFKGWDKFNKTYLSNVFVLQKYSDEYSSSASSVAWETAISIAMKSFDKNKLDYQKRELELKIEKLEEMIEHTVLYKPSEFSISFKENNTPTSIGKNSLLSPVLKINSNQGLQNITPKLFISHASADSDITDEFVHLLTDLGVKTEDIFYSSMPAHSIYPGEDFLNRLKKELNDEKVIVIFLLSENFYKSPVCLCEMGAAWVKAHTLYPVLLPGFKFSDVKGVIQSIQSTKVEDKSSLNVLAENIKKEFSLADMDHMTWESKMDRMLKNIQHYKKG